MFRFIHVGTSAEAVGLQEFEEQDQMGMSIKLEPTAYTAVSIMIHEPGLRQLG